MKLLSTKQISWWIISGAAGIELLTIALRFGLELQATRDTASNIGVLTGGIRIHHGYIGILLLIISLVLWRYTRPFAQRMLIIGAALLISDLIHHFVVLWLLTGNPEFNILY